MSDVGAKAEHLQSQGQTEAVSDRACGVGAGSGDAPEALGLIGRMGWRKIVRRIRAPWAGRKAGMGRRIWGEVGLANPFP